MKPFKFFKLDGGTYEHRVYGIVTSDIPRAVKTINKKWGLPDNERRAIVDTDFNYRGKVFKHPEWAPIIWIPCIPSCPQHHATLSHEIFHAVCEIMRWAHIPLSEESEEAYAHQIRYLEEQFYNKIK